MGVQHAFQIARSFLEVGYYVSGIALVFIAYRGLAQISVAKELAATAAKRESFKLAVEQCHFYAEKVVPTRNRLLESARAKGVAFVPPKSQQISEGEVVAIDVGGRNIASDSMRLGQDVVDYANQVEAFAMAFTSRVADEVVAYRETALGFRQVALELLPFIDHCRKNNLARYESTVQLFEIWSARITSEELTRKRKEIDEHLQGLKDTKIKVIGTE